MKMSPQAIASFLEQAMQEQVPSMLKKFQLDFDPAEIRVTIRRDPHVPSGIAISATGKDLHLVDGEDRRVQEWLMSGDTGISSKVILSFMTGLKLPKKDYSNWPHDPSDLGRCVRLLDRFPEWRPRLPEMASAYPAWKPMLDNWAEMERLYSIEIQRPDNRAPQTYELMKQLEKECHDIEAGDKR